MKIRTLVSILILVLSVLVISSCATTPKTQEEMGGVGRKELFRAVKSGDVNKVKRTALMIASQMGYTKVARLLIKEGADVVAQSVLEHRSYYDWRKKIYLRHFTALMYASSNGHTEIVKLLIEAGAWVNRTNAHRCTALIYASRNGHTEVAKLLIEEGVDVNAKTPSMSDYFEVCGRAPRGLLDVIRGGYTALMYASREGHTEVAKLLIEEGVDVNAENNSGRTALKIARKRGRDEIVKLLEEAGAKE
jgi:ankyrin repeat protein